MASKPKYKALVGIDFEGMKPPVQVKPGDIIPSTISANEIKQMLECRPPQIKEVIHAERGSVE